MGRISAPASVFPENCQQVKVHCGIDLGWLWKLDIGPEAWEERVLGSLAPASNLG